MTNSAQLTEEERYLRLYDTDENFRAVADAWPHLTEWQRWRLYSMVVWVVFREDVRKLLNHLGGAVGAAFRTLKR